MMELGNTTWFECKWKMRNKGLAVLCGFCEVVGVFVLFFQKWLVTIDVMSENLAIDLVFLQKFSWTIGPFIAFQVANQDSLITNIVFENLHEQFLQSGWTVGKILMGYLMFCPLDAMCLFISPVTLTMLVAAMLKIWCAELKGDLAKTGEELLLHFLQILLYTCPPENVLCPRKRTPWNTALLQFTLLWFKLCYNVRRMGGKGKCLFSGDCVKLMTVHALYYMSAQWSHEQKHEKN